MQSDYILIEGEEQDTAQLGDVRSAAGGDLNYLINKYLVFVRNDGTYSKLDNEVMRINRLNRKLKKWEDVVKVELQYIDNRVYEIGLSYRPGEKWSKLDVSRYLENVIKYIGKDGLIAYAWVVEMQARRVEHYHLDIVTTANCRKIRMPDKSGEWSHGSSSRKELYYLMIGYLTSDYMRKKEQKKGYQRGIRVFGTYLNNRYFDENARWALKSTSYPAWLVENINNQGLVNPIIKRSKGGGFVVRAVGDEKEYFWKNNEGYVLTGKKASDFLELEKYKYPIPF